MKKIIQFKKLTLVLLLIAHFKCNNNSQKTTSISVTANKEIKNTSTFPIWHNLKWGISQEEVRNLLANNIKIKKQNKKSIIGICIIENINYDVGFYFNKNKLDSFGCHSIIELNNNKIDEFRKSFASSCNVPFKWKNSTGVMIDYEPFNNEWAADFYQPNEETQITLNVFRNKNSKKVTIKIEGIWFGHYSGPE